MNEASIQLRSKQGKAIAFDGITVNTTVTGALANTSLKQHYCNTDKEAIEIVYEFPLPQHGVLLDLTIIVGEKILHGTVTAKAVAEAHYEQAVIEGNGAFLLRELQNGLYQINIGNLLPQEKCFITLDYVEILETQDDSLRYRLPTVISPHYGDPATAGLSQQDAPQTSWQAEYGMHITVRIERNDRKAITVSSPTHTLRNRCEEHTTVIEIDPRSLNNRMDRDFILLIQNPQQSALTVWQQAHEDGFSVLALLSTAANQQQQDRPLHLTVVVDCSGSMGGDSITQARTAIIEIIERMNERDTLSILCFGSTQNVWTPKPVAMNAQARQVLTRRAQTLQADLGGTEMLPALKMALHIAPPEGQILLITDGECYTSETDIQSLANHCKRFFTVGVGSSVSENIVRNLAFHSGGYCELVTPNENMKGRIVQQMYRMRQPMASLSVDWGNVEPTHSVVPTTVFLGDSILFSALLPTLPAQLVASYVTNNTTVTLQTTPSAPPALLGQHLPRIVAWQQLATLNEQQATALAVKHQLVTQWTSMSAVLERDAAEQTDGLPALVKVQQMAAAGYGGFGSAFAENPKSHLLMYDVSEKMMMSESCARFVDFDDTTINDNAMDLYEKPVDRITTELTPLQFIESLKTALPLLTNTTRPFDYQPLHEIALNCLLKKSATLPEAVLNHLLELTAAALPDQSTSIQQDILYATLIMYVLDDLLKADFREYRALRQRLQKSGIDATLIVKLKPVIANALAGSSADNWVVTSLEKV